jgi:hypothetical protein
MWSEIELVFIIHRTSRQADSVAEAIGSLQSTLKQQFGQAILLIESREEGLSPSTAQTVADFMDSREFPVRTVHTAPLYRHNRRAGRLVACFGGFGVPGKSLSMLASTIADDLSEVFARCRHKVYAHSEAA